MLPKQYAIQEIGEGKRGRHSYFDDMFGEFDQMKKNREFEESCKDLIREYFN